MGKNKYLFLSGLCILCIIIMRVHFSLSMPATETIVPLIDEKVLIQKVRAADFSSPAAYMLILVGLSYLLVFLLGIINLIIFAVRTFMRKPLLRFSEEEKKFPLSREKTGKVVFAITFMVFLTFAAEIMIYAYTETINIIPIALFLNLALEVAVIIVILYFVKKSFLGFSMKGKHFLGLAQIFTATLPLVVIAALLIYKLGIKSSSNPMIYLIFSIKDNFFIYILLLQVVVFAPLAEELLFRGFIYKLLRKRYSFFFSATATSLFFASIHSIPYQILPLFIISLSLCYLYEKTQNIAAPTVFHSLFNSVNIALVLALKNWLH